MASIERTIECATSLVRIFLSPPLKSHHLDVYRISNCQQMQFIFECFYLLQLQGKIEKSKDAIHPDKVCSNYLFSSLPDLQRRFLMSSTCSEYEFVEYIGRAETLYTAHMNVFADLLLVNP